MSFPRRLLTDDEEVVVELRPHWSYLGWPLIVTVAVVALAMVVAVSYPHASVWVLYVMLVLVAVTALWLSSRLVRWFASSLTVTTYRIVQRSGVISRHGLELRLERVNQLSYNQSLADRLLRTGELLIEVGGDTGVVVFDHVPRPAAVQSVVTEQITAMRRRADAWSSAVPEMWDPTEHWPTGDTPASGIPVVTRPTTPDGSVADRLVQLDELRRRGIVNDAEFKAKKAELLDRL